MSLGNIINKTKKNLKKLACVGIVGLTLAGARTAKASLENLKYDIIRLSVPPVKQEYSYSYPYAINDKGEVVGTFGEGTSRPEQTSRRSFVYKDGNMIDTSLDEDCEGMSINNLSDMFIWAGNRGYIVENDGSKTRIDFWGKSMNDNNWVVGREYIYNGDTGETIHKGARYHFKSINNDNIAVGYWPFLPGPQKAFKYDGDVITFLDSLQGHSVAMDINNKGQIVGSSTKSGTHACIWGGSGISKLPELDNYRNWSRAYAINDLGEIVGICRDNRAYNAVLYKEGEVIKLDTFLPEDSEWRLLERAVGINNKGQIIGCGYIYDNPHRQAFLMNPIMECSVDIKPRSCPNPLKVKGKGKLLVAILGSENFDVYTIDTASIRLAGVAPIASNYKDVAAPVPDGNECECTKAGRDGYTDLIIKYKTNEIVNELVNIYGPLVNGDVFELTLTARLYNGTPIEGVDCIMVAGKKHPKAPKDTDAKRADINKDGIVNFLDFSIIAEHWLERTKWYKTK